MASCGKPAAGEFEAFYAEYLEACRTGDAAFLRRMLPPGVPDDEFEFVVQSSREFVLGLDESGAKPDIRREGSRVDVVYVLVDGDDRTEWKLDFYCSGGRWLKYDPGQEGAGKA